MIVTCPGCSAKYRVKDSAVPDVGAKMKCPKCGKLFAAHRVKDGDDAVPQPVDFTGEAAAASDGAAPAPESVAQEWDSMMQAEGLVLAQAPAAVSTTPPGVDPMAGVAPEAAATPRDPFYEANPAVAERPAGAELGGGITQDAQMHSPAQGFIPAAGDAAGEEVSDPFVNIDLTAPASQPVAGEGDVDPLAASRAAAAQRAAPTPTPAAPAPAATESAAVPKTSAGIAVRDRSGEIHTFKYLPPARQWVAAHPDPEGLEVSIAGAPFTRVTMTHAFADLSLERSKAAADALETDAPATAIEASNKGSAPAAHETFPPPATPSVLERVEPQPPSRLAKAGLIAAAALLGLTGLYALWQFEVLPLEPFLTRTITGVTGARSPLVIPPADPEQDLEGALEAAAEAREKGSLALAVIHYRRALAFKREDAEILRQLASCYTELGDTSAAAELRRIDPSAFTDTPAAVPKPDAEE